MEVVEKKLGRIFRFSFTGKENFFDEIYHFAREHGVQHASLFVIGALGGGKMVTGFLNKKSELSQRPIGEKREFLGMGTLSWPQKRPNAVPESVPWNEAQPYAHIHFASGPDVGVEQKETLVGHLREVLSLGGYVDLYELL